MRKQFIHLFVYAHLFGAGCLSAQAQSARFVEEEDTTQITIHFYVGRHNLVPDALGNDDALKQLDSIFAVPNTDNRKIIAVHVSAFASFEANYDYNLHLAYYRAETVYQHILKQYGNTALKGIPVDIVSRHMGEDWKDLRAAVYADPNVPYKDELSAIINQDIHDYDDVERVVRQLRESRPYRYLLQHIMPGQRKSTIHVIYSVRRPALALIPSLPLCIERTQPPPMLAYINVPARDTVPEPLRFVALKTNLIWVAAGVANAGVELPVKSKFSVHLPITYSPYTIRRNWRVRTLTIQPELRYWPGKQQMQGHYFGLHGSFGWWNVSFDYTKRFQDRDRRTPLWGAGIDYGYALRLSHRWNIEFGLGLGYIFFDYDVFHNTPNVDDGQRYQQGTIRYWGITTGVINLIYKLYKDKKKEK